MLLTIDIGNTSTSFCIFDSEEIIERFELASDLSKSADEYGILISNLLRNFDMIGKISNCAISSVVLALDEIYDAALRKYLNLTPFWINYKVKMPFKIGIDAPKELGADRIANAAWAVQNYELPAIIIDFGTATTFDIIDENKNFLGGLIAPGLRLQAQSLAKFTSKLPKLKIEAVKDPIGRNTVDAMLSGVVYGHCAMVSGMIGKCEKELDKKTTIVACGGFSEALYDKIERKFDYIDKDLTHKGIRLLWKLN